MQSAHPLYAEAIDNCDGKERPTLEIGSLSLLRAEVRLREAALDHLKRKLASAEAFAKRTSAPERFQPGGARAIDRAR